VVQPQSCRVIYYYDTPAFGIRHQLFDRVTLQDSFQNLHLYNFMIIKRDIYNKDNDLNST
jgi:hypothetical protein